MFAYCNNNPVNFVDFSGFLPYESIIASDQVFAYEGVSRFDTIIIPSPNKLIDEETLTDVIDEVMFWGGAASTVSGALASFGIITMSPGVAIPLTIIGLISLGWGIVVRYGQ